MHVKRRLRDVTFGHALADIEPEYPNRSDWVHVFKTLHYWGFVSASARAVRSSGARGPEFPLSKREEETQNPKNKSNNREHDCNGHTCTRQNTNQKP